MQKKLPSAISTPTYVINRTVANYTVWKFDLESAELFTQHAAQQKTALDSKQYNLCTVGGYLMAYSNQDDAYKIDYSVFKFNPDLENPLNSEAHQKGHWKRSKFISYSNHLTWNKKETDILQLIPMTGYVLAYTPTSARSTYCLWNFDPALDSPKKADPLSNSITTKDAFSIIGENSQLIPIENYVLEWIPSETSSSYRVWSFDPQ